ncbi:hypothetical protein RJ639_002258 [Escallonia herrerae]|uniref:Tafazzin family protein n=1 Tax=Escallonia herrerae TaxID=1293975 RepID=A0AA88XGI0_9ASTE|nr:hypothetical protein RJ639_002258 [Escallonia herrerae]
MVGRWIEAGDLWKDKAHFLQLQFRNRFRVAVDRHCRRRSLCDGYLSTTMQRWLDRFHSFRRDSLPSSSTFYHKRVSKVIDAEEDPVVTLMLQAVAVPVIGNVCHVFMHGLNRVQIYGAEKLHQAMLHRPAKKPLITVSNHVAAVDDPLVIASLLPPGVLFDAHSLRWTLCAADRCFRTPVTSAFFKYVKVLPVSRGDGIYQKDWKDCNVSILESHSPQPYFGKGFSHEGGIVSRIRDYMGPTELMGFAARGFFMDRTVKDNVASMQEVGPLKAWHSFLELCRARGSPSNFNFVITYSYG